MIPLVWCLLASFVAAAPSLVKHSLPNIPTGWSKLEDTQLSPSRGLNLRFGLAQHRFSHLESLLRNISDPAHASYGQHLSKDQVQTLSKPSDETLELVDGWLATHNATSVKWSASQDSVSAVVPLAAAEDMLSTRFGVFEHAKSGKQVVRTLSYSLPLDLIPHINFVHPTTAFFDPTRHGLGKSMSGEDTTVARPPRLEKRPVALNQSDFVSCVDIIDPPCVRKVYNIGNYSADAATKGNNRIGVAGYLDIWARPDSFQLYINDYIPESRGSNFTLDVVNITGPFTQNSFSDEGNLDTQLAIQVAYPIPITYYTTNSVPPYIPDQNQDGEIPGVNEPYLDFIDYLLGLDEPPTVITTSYGDDEQTDYANAVCQGFAKLGARGVSVLFSTGDEGLGVDDLSSCIANTGNNATTFLPDFPASCPYVTSVGETAGISPQTASTGSGAGFSYYFERPVVPRYSNEETAMQSRMYNHRGRAYPDIVCAGAADRFSITSYNRWDLGGGTSAAVPTAASIVALLNEWRLWNGKPTMGFLNPFLYGAGFAGMVDITEGSVDGCEQPGFNATAGWDPATGLGSFDFQKLQSLVL
ncbi:peptidase S8/S53 domain-containing protein [Mycena metata]|uniref:tripeptidyl-peptidase II n=1 Tax=Mycena metata TaxID=1033252 RepID=A0AAD7IK28_9AGAR|nr:peptidase S8/S53 domain-containing protein [Mycena metata]